MAADTIKERDQESMDLEFGSQIEEILEDQLQNLERKVRNQLEEKALTWVEEECKKRLETLRETIREEIYQEVENWIQSELKRRMKEFKKRNTSI